MERWESSVEKAIRDAQERGEFDNLPGAGKPLPPINPNDPDWFVKQWATREQLDFTGALPPAIALRKEAAGFPESLRELRTEESVRQVLIDFNRRVREDRLRPGEGQLPRILAPTVDVDALVEQWRVLRVAARREATADVRQDDGIPTTVPDASGWFRRWVGRRRPGRGGWPRRPGT